jgi:hypothetical protein
MARETTRGAVMCVLSRRELLWMRVWQGMCVLLLVLNVLAAGFDLYIGSYGLAVFCGGAAISLLIVFVQQIRLIHRLQHWEEIEREIDAHFERFGERGPQQQLEHCFVCSICPDCGKVSLADFGEGKLMCSEVDCNSRFHRDVEGKWSRL